MSLHFSLFCMPEAGCFRLFFFCADAAGWRWVRVMRWTLLLFENDFSAACWVRSTPPYAKKNTIDFSQTGIA